MEERKKLYVEVVATHKEDGTCHPNVIKFPDERCFVIDRVIKARRAASLKVGGCGIRYTVSIMGKETFLFDEENGRWFVELKES